MSIADVTARVPMPGRSLQDLDRSVSTSAAAASTVAGYRDLRLDLFRGLALITIFVDHTYQLRLAQYTIKRFMFFDASEMFVFIAGYTAALVYGRCLLQLGAAAATARIYRRIGQIYGAQLALFCFLYFCHAGWLLVSGAPAPDFATMLLRTLMLHGPFTLMDILPAYIVLLAVLPGLLLLLRVQPVLLIGLSGALYAATLSNRWDLAATGLVSSWVNIPAWQFLFVIGLAAGHWTLQGGARLRLPSWLPWLSLTAVGFFVLLHIGPVRSMMMTRLPFNWLWGKYDLGLICLVNFLLVVYLVASLIRRDSRLLRWRAIASLVRCGQHSLPIFCIGAGLSACGSLLLERIDDGLLMNVGISVVGGAVLIGAAMLLEQQVPAALWRRGVALAHRAQRARA